KTKGVCNRKPKDSTPKDNRNARRISANQTQSHGRFSGLYKPVQTRPHKRIGRQKHGLPQQKSNPEARKNQRIRKADYYARGRDQDHYIADHYNACTAAYKTNGDFVNVATADSRMQQVLQRTHDMTPTGVRMISKLAYVR